MLILTKGRYRARIAKTICDIEVAQRLRQLAFTPGVAAADIRAKRDADKYDAVFSHILVEELATGRLVCCFRVLPLSNGAEIGQSYSAQYYELSMLSACKAPVVEMGRFCIDPKVKDPDIIRVAWAAMTRFVDQNKIKLMFGCASFHGVDAAAYGHAFALLQHRYLAPNAYYPHEKAGKIIRFADCAVKGGYDHRQALRQMPPLLRTYLAMGGWVSDHAVVDRQMNTLHVFVGVEVEAIPLVRKHLLRSLAPA